MFKRVGDTVLAFDLEWVPDPVTGRLVHGLPADMPDSEVVEEMWRAGGASDEKPRPYLKTVLCRVVSVAAVWRQRRPDGAVRLTLSSYPEDTEASMPEAELLTRFLDAVGDLKPQLVGFNSSDADIPILLQRGVAAGVRAKSFSERPDKPWEGMDYFARYGDDHVDLKSVLSGWGKATPSLHELAQASGIPGKMGTDGRDVVDLWSAGELRRIVQYNQYDALTTYLLWLRTAHFAGFFTTEEYTEEEQRVRDLLLAKKKETEYEHLGAYLQRWEELTGIRDAGSRPRE